MKPKTSKTLQLVGKSQNQGRKRTTIGWGVTVVACLALGAWLHRWNQSRLLQPGSGPATGAPKIVFEKGLEICIMNLDGSGFKKITQYPNNGLDPRFSPDRRKVIYIHTERNPLGHNNEIYVMGADGSNQTRLTKTSERSERSPAYSSNGKQVVFSSYMAYIDHPPPTSLGMMNSDGFNYTELATKGSRPIFSPDGTRIAFFDDGLAVSNADGTNQQRLPQFGSDPSFSPDGQRIVYVSRQPTQGLNSGEPRLSTPNGIAVANIAGSQKIQLVNRFKFYNSPVFTPDGHKIVFSAAHEWLNHDIYIINADGSRLKNLTNTKADEKNIDVR